MAAVYATDGDSNSTPGLIKIMSRHGLRKNQQVDLESVSLPKLLDDLMKWSDKHLPDSKKLNLIENVMQTDYAEYRIVEHNAYVSTICKDRQSETRLKRMDGSWFLV
ncbi:MAG: hypothetical protein AB8G18_13695 [Gammaproteobacteria bacterium]